MSRDWSSERKTYSRSKDIGDMSFATYCREIEKCDIEQQQLAAEMNCSDESVISLPNNLVDDSLLELDPLTNLISPISTTSSVDAGKTRKNNSKVSFIQKRSRKNAVSSTPIAASSTPIASTFKAPSTTPTYSPSNFPKIIKQFSFRPDMKESNFEFRNKDPSQRKRPCYHPQRRQRSKIITLKAPPRSPQAVSSELREITVLGYDKPIRIKSVNNGTVYVPKPVDFDSLVKDRQKDADDKKRYSVTVLPRISSASQIIQKEIKISEKTDKPVEVSSQTGEWLDQPEEAASGSKEISEKAVLAYLQKLGIPNLSNMRKLQELATKIQKESSRHGKGLRKRKYVTPMTRKHSRLLKLSSELSKEFLGKKLKGNQLKKVQNLKVLNNILKRPNRMKNSKVYAKLLKHAQNLLGKSDSQNTSDSFSTEASSSSASDALLTCKNALSADKDNTDVKSQERNEIITLEGNVHVFSEENDKTKSEEDSSKICNVPDSATKETDQLAAASSSCPTVPVEISGSVAFKEKPQSSDTPVIIDESIQTNIEQNIVCVEQEQLLKPDITGAMLVQEGTQPDSEMQEETMLQPSTQGHETSITDSDQPHHDALPMQSKTDSNEMQNKPSDDSNLRMLAANACMESAELSNAEAMQQDQSSLQVKDPLVPVSKTLLENLNLHKVEIKPSNLNISDHLCSAVSDNIQGPADNIREPEKTVPIAIQNVTLIAPKRKRGRPKKNQDNVVLLAQVSQSSKDKSQSAEVEKVPDIQSESENANLVIKTPQQAVITPESESANRRKSARLRKQKIEVDFESEIPRKNRKIEMLTASQEKPFSNEPDKQNLPDGHLVPPVEASEKPKKRRGRPPKNRVIVSENQTQPTITEIIEGETNSESGAQVAAATLIALSNGTLGSTEIPPQAEDSTVAKSKGKKRKVNVDNENIAIHIQVPKTTEADSEPMEPFILPLKKRKSISDHQDMHPNSLRSAEKFNDATYSDCGQQSSPTHSSISQSRGNRASASKALQTIADNLENQKVITDTEDEEEEDDEEEDASDEDYVPEESESACYLNDQISSVKERVARAKVGSAYVDLKLLSQKNILSPNEEKNLPKVDPPTFPFCLARSCWWIPLNKSTYEKYFPPIRKITIQVESTALDTGPKPLECFQNFSSNLSNSSTFFCGGPINASAFCPTPSKEMDQYLAIATSDTTIKALGSSNTKKSNGLIQLWNLGRLDSNVMQSEPKMEIAFAHNSGYVTDMKWCPNSCYQDPDTLINLQQDSTEDIIPRLGLLAVASTDSYIRIYSVPHPRNMKEAETEYPFYSAMASVVCQPEIDLPMSKKSICVSISWTQESDSYKSSVIAAGYANGMVCLFHIDQTVDCGIRPTANDMDIIVPCYSFQAQRAPVTSVAFAPHNGGSQWLVTTGMDKVIHFYDLKDPSLSVCALQRSSAREAEFAPFGCGIFYSQLDGISARNLFFKDVGIERLNDKYIANPALSLLKISASQFQNAVALSFTNGKVIVTLLNQLHHEFDPVKIPQYCSYELFSTKLTPLNEYQTIMNEILNKAEAMVDNAGNKEAESEVEVVEVRSQSLETVLLSSASEKDEINSILGTLCNATEMIINIREKRRKELELCASLIFPDSQNSVDVFDGMHAANNLLEVIHSNELQTEENNIASTSESKSSSSGDITSQNNTDSEMIEVQPIEPRAEPRPDSNIEENISPECVEMETELSDDDEACDLSDNESTVSNNSLVSERSFIADSNSQSNSSNESFLTSENENLQTTFSSISFSDEESNLEEVSEVAEISVTESQPVSETISTNLIEGTVTSMLTDIVNDLSTELVTKQNHSEHSNSTACDVPISGQSEDGDGDVFNGTTEKLKKSELSENNSTITSHDQQAASISIADGTESQLIQQNSETINALETDSSFNIVSASLSVLEADGNAMLPTSSNDFCASTNIKESNSTPGEDDQTSPGKCFSIKSCITGPHFNITAKSKIKCINSVNRFLGLPNLSRKSKPSVCKNLQNFGSSSSTSLHTISNTSKIQLADSVAGQSEEISLESRDQISSELGLSKESPIKSSCNKMSDSTSSSTDFVETDFLTSENYKEFVNNYCVVFNDGDLTTEATPIPFAHEEDDGFCFENYCMLAINTIKFNPNEGCHHWIFSGGMSGIARLSNVSKLEFKQTKTNKF